jgi:hypothetical protein
MAWPACGRKVSGRWPAAPLEGRQGRDSKTNRDWLCRNHGIAIGKILDVSEAAVRMMRKRAGIRRANRVFLSLDDWQAVIIRAELKAELARKDKANGTMTSR